MKQPQQEATSKLRDIAQFCSEQDAFKPGGIRHYIFTRGGPDGISGVYRFGRKILIDPTRFIQGIKDGEATIIAGRASK